MKFIRRNIQKTNRNGVINTDSTTSITNNGSTGSFTSKGDYLPATPNGDGTYTVNLAKVHFNGNIIANGEVTAYKKGTDGEISGGNVVVYDGLDSSDSTIALSANQGRILKELVDTKGEGTGNLENYYTREETDKKIADLVNGAPETLDTLKEIADALDTNKDAVDALNKSIATKADKEHKHTTAEITGLDTKLTNYENHLVDTTKHITSTERTNWNDANSKKHSHTNKSLLDSITQSNIDSWNNKLDKSVWDKAFYFDGNDIRVRLNLIGDKEVSAYGKGETGSSGAVTIIDSLNSSATDAALSANQGRILKNMIDNKEVNLSNYYDKATSDNRYLQSIPSEYITESELNDGSVWNISIYGNAATSNSTNCLNVTDNRDVDEEPHQKDVGFYADFKSRDRNGLNDGGIWSGVLTFRPYGTGGDFSGGYSHQLGFTQNENIWYRKATDNHTWGNWVKMAKVTDNVASATYANHLKDTKGTAFDLKYGGTGNGETSADYLACFTDSGNHIAPIQPSRLSVNYANSLKPYQKNEGGDKVLISGVRSDDTWNRQLVDDGWRLQFRGIRPQYEGSNIATANDLSSYLPKSGGTLTGDLTFSNCNIELGTNWLDGYDSAGILRMDEGFNTYVGAINNSASVNVRSGYLKVGNLSLGDSNTIDCNTSRIYINYAQKGDVILAYGNGSGGNVGIGTNTPSQKLHVNGNIIASGEITAYATNTKTLEETPTTMSLADENPRVYDGLDSTEDLVALSANQGRILLGMIEDLKAQVANLQNEINTLKTK